MGVLRVVLGLLLSVVFLMLGAVKLSPKVHEETHDEIALEFASKYADIWMVSEFGITHEEFRMLVGAAEIAFAVLLWIFPRLSALGIMTITACAAYSHYAAHDPPEKMAVAGAFFTLGFVFMLMSGGKRQSSKKKRQ